MNTQHPLPAATSTAATAQPLLTRRRIDGIDQPARPLGPKRAALQARRCQQSAAGSLAQKTHRTHGEQVLVSKPTGVAFVLHATPTGLLVERTQRQLDGTRLVQALAFADRPAFDRWCASDPIRFQDPMLYEQLRRHGHEALAGDR